MLKKTQGGIPPDGKDFNGILKMITALNRWESTGLVAMFDSVFSTAIGGYPKGVMLLGNDYLTLWISTADYNTNDPNTTQTGWQKLSDEIKNSLALGSAAYRNEGTGANQIPDMAFFNATFGIENGFFCIPSAVALGGKLIVQYGASPNVANATTTTTYPIPFPNICLSVIATGYNGVANIQTAITQNSINTTNFQWNAFAATGGQPMSLSDQDNGVLCKYIAIGY